jgi:FMN reductase
MSRRSLVVVSAGLGVPSSSRLLADRLVEAAVAELGARGVDADVQVVELRELAHDLTNHLLTGFAAPALAEALAAVRDADALVAVTPVFNASYSGLFKTFFDVLEEGSLEGTPVLLGATGGTARHSLVVDVAMRPLMAYLRALPVATGVFAASEDWASAGEGSSLASRVVRAGRELAAAVAGREPAQRPDPFADPVPFSALLAGG